MGILTNYIKASDVIQQRCLRDEDFAMSKAPILLSYLPTVYNDLRFEGTKTTVYKKYYINKENNTLAIPHDCLLLIAVGYEDECGSIVGMWYNDALPKDILFENRQDCGCDVCGDENTLCSSVKEFDNVEQEVIIFGDEYTNITKTSILEDGRILQYTKTYMASDGSGDEEEVIFVEKTEQICSLDLSPCGCVAKTEDNKKKLQDLEQTCCSLSTNRGRYDKECCHNKDPHSFTLDIQGKLIVFSPNYVRDYAIIKYVSAVNSAGDYQIPSLALEVVLSGLKYYYETNNPKAQPNTKGQGGMYHKMYQAQMNKFKKRIRPMPYERYMKAMGVVPVNLRKGYIYNNNVIGVLNGRRF